MQRSKRIEWIDINKGIGIILVLLLHSCTSAIRYKDNLTFLLYTFGIETAVPIMYFVSGCTFCLNREKYILLKNSEYLSKLFKNLIIPYISYNIFVYLIFEIANHLPLVGNGMSNIGYGHMTFINFFIGLVVGNNLFSIHTWFLYTLFIYEIIAYFVYKYLKKDYILIIIAAVSYLLFIFVGYPKSLAWADGMLYYMFFVLGIFMLDKRIPPVAGAISIILCIGSYAIFISPYNMPLLKYITEKTLTITAVISSYYISRILKNRFSNIFRFLGMNSMTLYLLQQPFWGSALGTILFKILNLPAMLCVSLCFIMSIIMPLCLRHILVRYKWFNFLLAIK